MTDSQDETYDGPRRRQTDFDAASLTFLQKTRTILGKRVERTVGEIIVVAIIVGFIGWFGFGQLEAIKDDQIADAEYDAAEATFQSDLRAYDQAVAAHSLCADSVGRSDANRDAWEQLANLVEQLGGDVAAAAAAQIRTNPVLSIPARTIDDCPTIPPVPVPPER